MRAASLTRGELRGELGKQLGITLNLLVLAHRHTRPRAKHVVEFKRRGGRLAIDYSDVPFKATMAQGGFVYSILFDEENLKSVEMIKAPE
jgi:hypothetical protein